MEDEREALLEPGEDDLIRRLKAHDAAAWAELYDQHHTSIWRYAAGRTGNREAADDVAAQVFLEALQSIGRFRPRGKPLLAWLYTIARNHAAKSIRRRRHESPGVPPDVRQEGIEGSVVDSVALAQALSRLTTEQRDVIALRHYGGCSTREIAAVLGKTERAVYSTETRALATLRRQLLPESRKSRPKADEIRPAPGIER